MTSSGLNPCLAGLPGRESIHSGRAGSCTPLGGISRILHLGGSHGRLGNPRALPFEQFALRFRSAFARVVAEASGFRNDTVAGDHDHRGVPRARRADGAARSGTAEPPRDLAVCERLARGNRPEKVQDLPLERSDLEMEGDVREVVLAGADVLQDANQVGMIGPRAVLGRRPRETHAGDAVAEDLQLYVQPEFPAEL